MTRSILILLLSLLSLDLFPQQGQLGISRIGMMPDSPQPLQIRDWKSVARNYDGFVFNLSKEGPYLPLMRLGTPGQFNYPGNTPIFLDSYVGADSHLNQAEAINIIPAIVGASLAGIDKSSQNGKNWVAMTRDFFNLRSRQNVYLNGYSTYSGSDWWYDVMPNVFFYQLRSLYPGFVTEFDGQFTEVADRWLNCVNLLGGGTTPWKIPYMNYRAFDLATGQPLRTGVPEPEAAGSISWLLFNAYTETGNKKYLTGAQLAMEFLTGLQYNPAYELQLPYGTITAARMNARLRTDYPLQTMLDWCFDRSPLRGWGAIVGKWGGYDVSGLIGEANDAGDDYAFVMNGFQQAAALAPLPKYDKRYARDIAKWILNLTNASRLFYPTFLPDANQDSREWSAANDTLSCIPHESMKEVWSGKSPYATGDALRGGWAATNLALYGGSSVGYLAAVTDTTNVPGILQIDLNRTDFYGDNALTTYLYFNPSATEQTVQVDFPGESAVYEAITETTLASGATSIQLAIPASEARLIRLYPKGMTPEARNGRLYAGDTILDYHYRYDYSATLYLKDLSVDHNPVARNTVFTAYCEPGNSGQADTVQFAWFLDDRLLEGLDQSQVQITAPANGTVSVLKCRISRNGQSAEDTLHISLLDHIPVAPVVKGIQSELKYTVTGRENTFTAIVEPAGGETLQYAWSATNGTFTQLSGTSATWQAPEGSEVDSITVKVTNQDGASTISSIQALVKYTNFPFQAPLIWYPFDADNRNAAADRFHATATGVTKTEDARGLPSLARRFTSGTDIISAENSPYLNFTAAVSLSCWVRCEQLGSERFIISHGSWQQRYKLSVTPEGRLRWTVKTSSGVADLDGTFPMELNRYYHVTALYTGYSMELYIDGALDAFKAFDGAILASTKPLTIGRMDDIETLYSWRGSVDEVKIWDREIPVGQVEQLKNEWATAPVDTLGELTVRLWPNPAEELIHIDYSRPVGIEKITVYTIQGRVLLEYPVQKKTGEVLINFPLTSTGLYIVRIILLDGEVMNRKILVRNQN